MPKIFLAAIAAVTGAFSFLGYQSTVDKKDKEIIDSTIGQQEQVNNPPSNISITTIVSDISEKDSIEQNVKLAKIDISDDGLGENLISIEGVDADHFEIIENTLFLKEGTELDFETKSSFSLTINGYDKENPSEIVSTEYTLSIIDEVEIAKPVIVKRKIVQKAKIAQPIKKEYKAPIALTNKIEKIITTPKYRKENLDDLFYNPKKYGFVSSIEYRIQNGDANGENGNTIEIDNSSLRETISYGFTDSFWIDASISYATRDEETTESGGDVLNTNNSGYTDPEFAFTYRPLEKEYFILDLGFAITPNIFSASTSDTEEEDGTVANGGGVYELGIALGGKTIPELSYRISANTIFLDTQSIDVISINNLQRVTTEAQTTARNDFSYGFDLQYEINRLFSIDAGIEFLARDSYSEDAAAISGEDQTDLKLAFNISIDRKKHSLVSIGYVNSSTDDRQEDNAVVISDQDSSAFFVSYTNKF